MANVHCSLALVVSDDVPPSMCEGFTNSDESLAHYWWRCESVGMPCAKVRAHSLLSEAQGSIAQRHVGQSLPSLFRVWYAW